MTIVANAIDEIITNDVKYLDVVTNTVTVTNFYIITGISNEEEWFYPLLKKLNSAKVDEEINIYLNTTGGSSPDTMQITSTIKRSKAKINLYIEGRCMSAGTIITFLPYDKYNSVTIDDDCDFLFHLGWMWEFGKPNDVLDSAEYWTTKTKNLYKTIFDGILTKDEISEINKGKELYLSGKVINQRIEKNKK